MTALPLHGKGTLTPPLTIAHALQHAAQQQLARIDAQTLLLHVLQRPAGDRAWLIAHDDTPLTPAQTRHWQHLLQRRCNGEPVAYLTGRKAFYGLELHITADVLDPRPDTETLVDWALELAHHLPHTPLRLLELGTGSGAVALALAHHLQHTQQRPFTLTATDASTDALRVAQANAQRLALPVQYLHNVPQAHNRWFAAVAALPCFDLIVSNPPYIADSDPHLPALRHEPRMALTSGADGLDDIRTIVQHAPAHLTHGGWLLLEHGHDQAEPVRTLLQQAGFTHIQHRHDLAGIARCTGGQWGESPRASHATAQ